MSGLKTDGATYARFEGMTWPLPPLDLDIEPGMTLTPAQAMRVRSVFAAYHQMIRDPEEKRRMVIRNLRAAMDGEGQP